MTNEELTDLRRWAAEVCGKSCFYSERGGIMVANDSMDAFAVPVEPWLPDQNIAQAFEVLEVFRQRFTNVSLCADNGWGLTLWNIIDDQGCRNIVGPINSDSPAMAILLACKAASDAK